MKTKTLKDRRLAHHGVGDDSDRPMQVVQIICLVVNVVFVIAIFVVAVLWSVARQNPLTDMMPAPNKDRSICVQYNEGGGSCVRKEMPETYIEEQMNKNMKRLQMQYMAEKLNYANVVCRKSSPSIHLYSGVDKINPRDNIRWTNDMVKNKNGNRVVTYGLNSGKFTVNKDGMYFVYSQIMEQAFNLQNNGTSFQIILLRNGLQETILESESAPCALVNSVGERAHYVGSAYRLQKDDLVFATHSNPPKIIDSKDTFMGIRELW